MDPVPVLDSYVQNWVNPNIYQGWFSRGCEVFRMCFEPFSREE